MKNAKSNESVKVVLKKDGNRTFVYSESGERLGSVRKFCCGVDFRPEGGDDVVFSILRERVGRKSLLTCIEKLVSCKIPRVPLHWNFSYETAKNECKFFAFKASLENYKG